MLALGYLARETHGASWRQLADAVQITPQAARARWGTEKSGRGRQAQRARMEILRERILGQQFRRASYEHERKFIVTDDLPLDQCTTHFTITQAYLWVDPADAGYSIRVRQTRGFTSDGRPIEPPATLTFKGPAVGGRRVEVNTEIPHHDAEAVIASAEGSVIVKERYILDAGEHSEFEIDVFQGDNAGLVLAEYEGERPAVQRLIPPDWAQEVTDDPRFRNDQLARHPIASWTANELRDAGLEHLDQPREGADNR
ncbi:hypothetical protein GCM10009788_11230 [Nocardioides humi]|uniref:CYTH domain-containing protein n=1 Tax=Nocardioides humi TaxID=449461 RepID=A0ABN2A0F4_9ACTN